MTRSVLRRRLLVGSGAILGVAGLGLYPRSWPAGALFVREAYAAGTRLDTSNPTANFTPEGGQGYTPSPLVLTLSDQSVSDIISFFASEPAAAPGSDLDIVATFQATGTPFNADGGVHLVINEGGTARAVIAVSVIKDGQRGIGLASGFSFGDPNNYPVFVQANWTGLIRVRVRRTAQGDGEIVEVNGIAPNPRAVLLNSSLPQRIRTTPTVEFGCASVEATTTATFSEFFCEQVTAVPGTLTFTDFRIRDVDSGDQLRFRGDFTLGVSSDGIDPASEQVELRLSAPLGVQRYPPSSTNPISGFDVHGSEPRRRWSLSDTEKARTGINRFDIDENPGGSGGIAFADRNANIEPFDFSTVNVQITVGDDDLVGSAELVEHPAGSGSWRLR